MPFASSAVVPRRRHASDGTPSRSDSSPRPMRHSPAVLAAVVLAVSTTASAQQIIGVREARALRADSVFQRFDRTDSPGCSLGVYQDGKILYARGYGMASLEHGVALSPRSVLDVGSISKQFTACLLYTSDAADERSSVDLGGR